MKFEETQIYLSDKEAWVFYIFALPLIIYLATISYTFLAFGIVTLFGIGIVLSMMGY